MSTIARVRLRGTTIGVASLGEDDRVAAFEYDPAFLRSGIGVAPLMMPLGPGVRRFAALPGPALHGLPGLLAAGHRLDL